MYTYIWNTENPKLTHNINTKCKIYMQLFTLKFQYLWKTGTRSVLV